MRLEVEVKGWRVVPGMIAAKMQGYAFVGERRVAEKHLSTGGDLAGLMHALLASAEFRYVE